MVQEKKITEIQGCISEKLGRGSVVIVAGLAALQTALLESGWCPQSVLSALDAAISSLAQLEAARRAGSHSPTIDRLDDRIQAELQLAIDSLNGV
jgi:hypothetical protein